MRRSARKPFARLVAAPVSPGWCTGRWAAEALRTSRRPSVEIRFTLQTTTKIHTSGVQPSLVVDDNVKLLADSRH